MFGPPRNEKLLKKDLPGKVRSGAGRSTGDGQAGEFKEVYLSGSAGNRTFLAAPALDGRAAAEPPAEFEKEACYPFDHTLRREFAPPAEAGEGAASPAGWKWLAPALVPAETQRYFERAYMQGGDWRRIDGDWLASAGQLALGLDSDTNNTSLVLAFEVGKVGAGPVLLFPGDAQVGNWLSWRRQPYRCQGREQTADDLLARTLIYKVGHHASQNATLRRDSTDVSSRFPDGVPFGLELMQNIIALIPVDRAAAQKPQPNPWDMPYAPLYRRLRDKAARRVLRSDDSPSPLRPGGDDRDIVPDSSGWSPVPGLHGVSWRKSTRLFTVPPKSALYFDIQIASADE